MVVVVAEVVDNKLVKEFNGGLVKFYLSKVKQIKFEVVVYGVVDQEVTKVVEQVNEELVEEVIKLTVVTKNRDDVECFVDGAIGTDKDQNYFYE